MCIVLYTTATKPDSTASCDIQKLKTVLNKLINMTILRFISFASYEYKVYLNAFYIKLMR